MFLLQGIAYALVAGLPPQYGLYSALMGSFLYTLLGSTMQLNIGATAILAFMSREQTEKGREYPILLAFLMGAIIFTFGVLQLGGQTNS